MGYFYDHLKAADPYLKVRGIAMPEVQSPEQVTFNLVTDGGRLADDITYEGSVNGIKRNLKVHWDYLTKEHFNTLFNAIVPHYRSTTNMFITVTFNSFSPDGIVTMTCYAGSNMITYEVEDTTDRLVDTLGQSYAYGGQNYDILYKNVEVNFVER